MGTVFSWNVADQLQQTTVTVKENCHFGLLFDHSSYMEAAVASIRATTYTLKKNWSALFFKSIFESQWLK